MSTRMGGMWIVSESIKREFPKISEEVLKRILYNYDKMLDYYYQFQAHTSFDEQIEKMKSLLERLEPDSIKDDFFEVLILMQLFIANVGRKQNW
jgi:hypothetical protein